METHVNQITPKFKIGDHVFKVTNSKEAFQFTEYVVVGVNFLAMINGVGLIDSKHDETKFDSRKTKASYDPENIVYAVTLVGEDEVYFENEVNLSTGQEAEERALNWLNNIETLFRKFYPKISEQSAGQQLMEKLSVKPDEYFKSFPDARNQAEASIVQGGFNRRVSFVPGKGFKVVPILNVTHVLDEGILIATVNDQKVWSYSTTYHKIKKMEESLRND